MTIPARYEDAAWQYVPKAIREAIEAMPETRRGLYIVGDVGTGKTYAAYAIAKYVMGIGKRPPLIWNPPELFHQLRQDFDRQPHERINPTEDMDPEHRRLVILDDIGAEKATDYVRETLYRLVNARYEARMPMVFTSNLSVAELAEQLGERTASRIVEMCDVVRLVGEDRRMTADR